MDDSRFCCYLFHCHLTIVHHIAFSFCSRLCVPDSDEESQIENSCHFGTSYSTYKLATVTNTNRRTSLHSPRIFHRLHTFTLKKKACSCFTFVHVCRGAVMFTLLLWGDAGCWHPAATYKTFHTSLVTMLSTCRTALVNLFVTAQKFDM